MIRVVLPYHLRKLAGVEGTVELELTGPVTQRSVLDALEARYPMLRGTIRDHATLERRAFLRFFACEQDFSNESPDAPLPDAVATGAEPLLVVGAMAGGSGVVSLTASGSAWGPRFLSVLRIVAAFLFMLAGTTKLFAFPTAPGGRRPVERGRDAMEVTRRERYRR